MFRSIRIYPVKAASISLFFLGSLIFFLFTLDKPKGKKTALTSEEKSWLDSHIDQISVSFDPGFAPFEFYDTEGHPRGYSADLIALIEKKIDFTFKKITSEVWFDVLKGLKEKKLILLPPLPQARSVKPFSISQSRI